jgi:uncharacterized protein (TIGR02266 family)
MDRVPIVFPIRFAFGTQAVQTTTRELSSTGVYVRCLTPPPAGESVRMKLYLPGTPLDVELEGVVRERAEGREAGFWAEFTGLRPAEQARIDDLLQQRARAPSAKPIGAVALQPAATDGRTFPRYNARFAVRFANVQDFVLQYAANISAGGVFVETSDPPAMDSVMRVSMELPGGGPPVEANAVVVHRVTPEQARQRSTPAGVGVQFVDADDKFRERIDLAISSILGT